MFHFLYICQIEAGAEVERILLALFYKGCTPRNSYHTALLVLETCFVRSLAGNEGDSVFVQIIYAEGKTYNFLAIDRLFSASYKVCELLININIGKVICPEDHLGIEIVCDLCNVRIIY